MIGGIAGAAAHASRSAQQQPQTGHPHQIMHCSLPFASYITLHIWHGHCMVIALHFVCGRIRHSHAPCISYVLSRWVITAATASCVVGHVPVALFLLPRPSSSLSPFVARVRHFCRRRRHRERGGALSSLRHARKRRIVLFCCMLL